jgi:hypothetical protein
LIGCGTFVAPFAGASRFGAFGTPLTVNATGVLQPFVPVLFHALTNHVCATFSN